MAEARIPPARNVEITVNGEKVVAKEGTRLLTLLRERKIPVPTLCHHKDLTPNGACRLCVVEVTRDGRTELASSCDLPVRAGLVVATDTERVRRRRRTLADLYLGRFPNVPLVREVAKLCGVTESRFAGEMSEPSPKACILCGMCVRACDEFMMERIIGFAGRGMSRHVAMPFGRVDEHCVNCTSCAYVCPTGALTIVDDKNGPADPKLVRDHGMKVNAEMATLDKGQCCMREVGTANIVTVMNRYDLLPVHNFQYGSHPDAPKIDHNVLKAKYFKQNHPDGCYNGCSMHCAKAVDDFELKTGPYKGQKVVVDGPEYETCGCCANMGCFDPDFVVEFNFYCDTYGIDTISMGTCTAFVMECFENGIITEKDTGGLRLNFGACDAVLELLHQMARGEGFGVEVGQGVRYLKEKWIREGRGDPQFLRDIGMEVKGLEYSEYMSKESLAQQGGYALTNKGPQHDEAWLIFMDMVNNQIPTFDDKAEALYYFPIWRTWFGLHGLCKLLWNDIVPADNYKEKEPAKIPDHVRNYLKFYEGVTGKPLTNEEMLNQSARVYNLQRVMSYMYNRGSREHDMPPYRSIGPVTVKEYESRAERYDKQMKELIGIDPAGKSTEEKVRITREFRMKQFEMLVDVVYKRRGWTRNGVPTIARLKELGIDLPEIVAIVKDAQE